MSSERTGARGERRRPPRVTGVFTRAGRSLAGRLMAAFVVTAVVIYVAAVAGLWWTGGRLLDDSARKQAIQWLERLDELGTPLYASSQGDAAAMQTLAARLENIPEITHVRYYDASGARVLGAYDRDEQGSVPRLTAERVGSLPVGRGRPYRLTPLGAARVRVTAPLQVRRLAPDALADMAHAGHREATRVIGYLDFVFDAGEQRVRFERSLVGGSVALALALLAAVALGRRKVRQALAPLAALEEPLARLARGDLSVDVGGGGDREIAAIREALTTTIAAFKEREEALRRAESDALTGLVNERYFRRQLTLELKRVERDGGTSAVLWVDLDRFRVINDTLGSAAGDRVLGQVAALLRARIRENDLLARLNGDRFVVLARGVGRDGAIKVARSIDQVLHEFHFTADDDLYSISVSIGIGLPDAAHATPDAVLQQAQAACAQAKRQGGGRYWLDDGDNAGATPEADSPPWSRHVRTAIQDNALRFLYQPILGLRNTGDREMYELLLRLVAPGGQLVSPTAFLPVADRFGLMVELDRWVVRRACEELSRLHADGRKATFFVNLSGHVFEHGDTLSRTVREELARHDLRGEYLVFEITEQLAVRYLHQARRVIKELGVLGCRFALDDFGSGFSSLNYLKHLPTAFLKISGEFVQHVATDVLDEVIVRSVVQIADALGMQTVAESVEDAETLQRIAALGVDFAQGYAVGRPGESLPDAEVFTFNRAQRAGRSARARGSTRRAAIASLLRKR
jgi:diguanylate cyclase (GGDEF)-like protein